MDITNNKGERRDVGNTGSIFLEGTTDNRLWLRGTGELYLVIGDAQILNEKALKLEGFNKVTVVHGVLAGGIQFIGCKNIFVADLIITDADTGILANEGVINKVDIRNTYILNSQYEGVYIGPSRAESSVIQDVTIDRLSVINCGYDNFQLGGVKYASVSNSVFYTLDKQRPFGQDKDVMINPFTTCKFTNVKYDTFFVHNQSSLYQ